MAKITSPNPAFVAGHKGSSSVQVKLDGSIILKSYTLTHTQKRRPFWVVDLYAIRNTMNVAEPQDP